MEPWDPLRLAGIMTPKPSGIWLIASSSLVLSNLLMDILDLLPRMVPQSMVYLAERQPLQEAVTGGAAVEVDPAVAHASGGLSRASGVRTDGRPHQFLQDGVEA